MGYYYEDDEVAGLGTNRCRRARNQVAGAQDRNRDFEFDAKIKISRADFCRSVRSCISDLVGGAADDRHNGRCCRHRR